MRQPLAFCSNLNIDPLAEKYLYNSTYAFSENKLINGIELEGLEQIQTFKTFDYSDNIFLNPITLVNNSVINFGNGFINTRNSAVSTYQYINKNGWGAYGSELGSQTKDAFSGIGNYF